MQVSIITINYNNLEGLKKTMSSVLDQTYRNIEFIIIDGGSTDGSKYYIESHDNSIAAWVSEPDKGIYNAMNKGVRKASGDYLLFLNSGDCLVNDSVIETFVSFNPIEDFIYGNIVWEYADGREELQTYPSQLGFSFFFESALAHQATLMKKSVFYNLFFYNEDYKVIGDLEFLTLAICKYHASYRKIELLISSFEMGGISNQREGRKLLKEERQLMYEKHFPLFYKDYILLKELKAIRRHYPISVLLNARFSPIRKKTINLFLGFIGLFTRKDG